MNQKNMDQISLKMQKDWTLAEKWSDKRYALNFTEPRFFEMHFKKLEKPKDFPFAGLFYSSISQLRGQWLKMEDKSLKVYFLKVLCVMLFCN